MKLTLKELAQKKDRLVSGHRACPGCSELIIMRQVLLAAADYDLVISCATGCLEVTTTIFPYTSWDVSFIHSAFENAAATAAGTEVAYRVLQRKGRINNPNFKFISVAGDGGTYDIGFQALSGALERRHNILFICLDNQAYMNTGVQRSSSTPLYAHTTTSPATEKSLGKYQPPKNLTACVIAHKIPYVAQAAPSHFTDLMRKVHRGLEVNGPAFINILAPCRLGWGFEADRTIQISRKAIDCCIWPLYEVDSGTWKLNYKPKEKLPVIEWLRMQARFQHIIKDAERVSEIQKLVDEEWDELCKRTICTQ